MLGYSLKFTSRIKLSKFSDPHLAYLDLESNIVHIFLHKLFKENNSKFWNYENQFITYMCSSAADFWAWM